MERIRVVTVTFTYTFSITEDGTPIDIDREFLVNFRKVNNQYNIVALGYKDSDIDNNFTMLSNRELNKQRRIPNSQMNEVYNYAYKVLKEKLEGKSKHYVETQDHSNKTYDLATGKEASLL